MHYKLRFLWSPVGAFLEMSFLMTVILTTWKCWCSGLWLSTVETNCFTASYPRVAPRHLMARHLSFYLFTLATDTVVELSPISSSLAVLFTEFFCPLIILWVFTDCEAKVMFLLCLWGFPSMHLGRRCVSKHALRWGCMYPSMHLGRGCVDRGVDRGVWTGVRMDRGVWIGQVCGRGIWTGCGCGQGVYTPTTPRQSLTRSVCILYWNEFLSILCRLN